MNVVDEKIKIKALVNKALNKDFIKKEKEINDSLLDLLDDIENDFFVVLVLGEFKRGKSTFINALLQSNLLPTDVLPETAVISTIVYNDTPVVDVVYKNGTVTHGTASQEYLSSFNAKQDQNLLEPVKYIKIGYPSEILADKMVIVDTPGVEDLDEQRCEVTYNYLPKANAVLFLLDAKSPLKKTEKEFIEKRLLPLGIDNIIFVVNKFDNVDEEEEEEFIEEIKLRLKKTFNISNGNEITINVYPLSAKWAIHGYLTQKAQMVKCSGIIEVKHAIKTITYYGQKEQDKVSGFKRRFYEIIDILMRDIKRHSDIKRTDILELQMVMVNLDKMVNEQEGNKLSITEFVDREKKDIISIVDKSLLYFQNRLLEDIMTDIDFYKGLDFKDFVEQIITRRLQKEMEQWVVVNSSNIGRLFKTVEHEIALGISYSFKQNVALKSSVAGMNGNRYAFDITADDVSSATTKAGIISAGGAGLMMLLGGPVLLPFISMAAFPLLQRQMLNNQLIEAKLKVKPAIQEQVIGNINKLRIALHEYIEEQAKIIIMNGEQSYDYVLNNLRDSVNKEMSEKASQKNEIQDEISVYNKQIECLDAMLQEV